MRTIGSTAMRCVSNPSQKAWSIATGEERSTRSTLWRLVSLSPLVLLSAAAAAAKMTAALPELLIHASVKLLSLRHTF